MAKSNHKGSGFAFLLVTSRGFDIAFISWPRRVHDKAMVVAPSYVPECVPASFHDGNRGMGT